MRNRGVLRLVSSQRCLIGSPLEKIDDDPLCQMLRSISAPVPRAIFSSQEGEALFETLRGRVYLPERLQETVVFLRKIDPLRKDRMGWNHEKMKKYSCEVAKKIDRWADVLLGDLKKQLRIVSGRRGRFSSNEFLLCAGLFYILTGYEPEELRATG